MSYPRPILSAWPAGEAPLDGRRPPHFVTEPLALIQKGEPTGTTVETFLAEHAGIPPVDLLAMWPGTTYYPSPGGVQEEVRSVLVEITPHHANKTPGARSGFTSSGRIGAIAAEQVLRAAQVGGLPDARLELNVYELLLTRGLPVGEWIGDSVSCAPAPGTRRTSLATLARAPRRAYVAAPPVEPRYLDIHAARFEELSAGGEVLASRTLEWVSPRQAGLNTVATALLTRVDGVICLGLDDDDLPAAQCFAGNSNLLVAPAFRLPRGANVRTAHAMVSERLARDYGVTPGAHVALGGPYFPTPGLTPEIVYPWAIELLAIAPAPRQLHFVALAELVAARAELPDGHLRVVALRAAHALGLLSPAGAPG